MNPHDAARIALACLDLTSLGDADGPAEVERLCRRAAGPFGPVAALCVWPRGVALARALRPAGVAVAAVANFPAGGSDPGPALRDVGAIVDAGADEVDVVMPWRDLPAAPALLAAVRRAAPGLTLKVILETGELREAGRIREAARIALDAGADFLKTSTGKVPVGATPGAARVLLETIAADAVASRRVGFKASGGVRTVADAAVYAALVREILGEAALVPARFRIGASALLDDIEAVLGRSPRADGAAPPAGY